jgi:DNA-binding MarR family transcriptional regulator
MEQDLIQSMDTIGMFCRLRVNMKPNIPIRPSEMGVLIFAQKQNTEVTPRMISQFLRISKPSVTSLVNSLVNQGYLSKKPSKVDQRSYVLTMTKSGNQLVESTFEEYYKSIALLKENMGEHEFRTFIELMQKANSILEENV